nr:hypothetical protein L203_06224 [Cryptococcus depauperatus CBS 7841]
MSLTQLILGVLLLVAAPPFIFYITQSAFGRSPQHLQQTRLSFSFSKKPLAEKAVLAVNTLYFLKQLLSPPYNVFTTNSLPILTPNDTLRQVLTFRFGIISPLEELLLTRLKLLDNRYLYSHLGHEPLTRCLWCVQPTDYYMFALPALLKPYAKCMIVIGLLAIPCVGGAEARKRRDAWMSLSAWTLLVGAIVEIGIKWEWRIQLVNGDCPHISSIIHTYRSLCLLALPLIYSLLPTPATSFTMEPSVILPYLYSLQKTYQYHSVTRQAVAQSQYLGTATTGIAKRDRARAEEARGDIDLWKTVHDAGLDADNLRIQTQALVADGWRTLMGQQNE